MIGTDLKHMSTSRPVWDSGSCGEIHSGQCIVELAVVMYGRTIMVAGSGREMDIDFGQNVKYNT